MPTTARWFALVALLLVSQTTPPADAAPDEIGATYVVSSTVVSPTGPLVSEELISLSVIGGKTLMKLHDRSGSNASFQVTRDRRGRIELETTDPAISCYNMAMTVLSDAASSSVGSAISVAFGGTAVNIPLQLTSTAYPDGSQGISVGGYVASPGITLVASGTVISKQNVLLSARFGETSLVSSSGTPVAQTSCTVARITSAPAAAENTTI